MTHATTRIPFADTILHPTDFSEMSVAAFAHALAIALIYKPKLTMLHAASGEKDWHRFPAVRSTLERWNMLEKGSRPEDVFHQLGIKVKKVGVAGANPAASIIQYLHDAPTDLIVLATEGRDGVARWLRPSLAEKLSRDAKTLTLFVPQKAKGFVHRDSGRISIKKILIPVDHAPNPVAAVSCAAQIALALGTPTEISILHVKTDHPMPALDLPKLPGVTWKCQNAEGAIVDEVMGICEKQNPDLLVMATAGHHGFLDALRGSTTEQVIRRSHCPVLAVPSAWDSSGNIITPD